MVDGGAYLVGDSGGRGGGGRQPFVNWRVAATGTAYCSCPCLYSCASRMRTGGGTIAGVGAGTGFGLVESVDDADGFGSSVRVIRTCCGGCALPGYAVPAAGGKRGPPKLRAPYPVELLITLLYV